MKVKEESENVGLKLNIQETIKNQRQCFANKGLSSQGCGFFSNQVYMWELDHK